MLHVPLAQELILKHDAERRRERHGEFERHAVAHQSLHHPQQRNVALGDRFEEPVFFEEMLMLGMPDERKVRVKNEGDVTRHTITFSVSFRAERGTAQNDFGHH